MQIVKLKNGLGLNVLILNPSGRETVVMVHGMFGNLSHFYLTIAPLIAKEFKVVLYDLKSQGRSDRVETGYDLETFADEVMELSDILGLKKVHLLGYSFGCLVVIKCAIKYPDRVGKIVAIEVPDKSKEPFMSRGSYTYEHFSYFVHYLNTDVRENFFKSKRQMQNTFKMHEYIYNHTTFSEDMNKEKEFQKDDFSQIKSPVLLAFGNKSVCIIELERIKNWIPNVDIYVEDGGHAFFSEKVEDSSKKILDFLNSSELLKKPSVELIETF